MLFVLDLCPPATWIEGTQLFTRCKGSNRYEQKW